MFAVIAEDDPALAELFSKAFIYAGFEVERVHTGDQVIRLINRTKPHVLILDMGLPGKSGLAILGALRRSGQHQYLKIIVVTGNHLVENYPEMQAVDLFLLKPVNIQELVKFAQRLHQPPC